MVKSSICRAKNPLTCPYHGLQSLEKAKPAVDYANFIPIVTEPVKQQPGETVRGVEVLFKTVHGSRLYGLSHSKSDDDFYAILTDENRKIKPLQTIVGHIDMMSLGFASFVSLAHKGVPQVLEAMFSKLTYGDPIEAYRKQYKASDPQVIDTYLRTIKSFSLSEDFKRRRHAIRLTMNLNELLHTGRFNPTLTPTEAILITNQTSKSFEEYVDYLNKISIIELDWEPSPTETKLDN